MRIKIEESAEAIWSRLSNPECAEIPIFAVIDGLVVGLAGLRVVPHIFCPGAHVDFALADEQMAAWDGPDENPVVAWDPTGMRPMDR